MVEAVIDLVSLVHPRINITATTATTEAVAVIAPP